MLMVEKDIGFYAAKLRMAALRRSSKMTTIGELVCDKCRAKLRDSGDAGLTHGDFCESCQIILNKVIRGEL
jgi:hypothetical protein